MLLQTFIAVFIMIDFCNLLSVFTLIVAQYGQKNILNDRNVHQLIISEI